MNNEEQTKEALKEALKEWLDEKFATFGKWAFASLAAAALVALIVFMLQMNGWRPPTAP